jgi:hypothetical protein
VSARSFARLDRSGVFAIRHGESGTRTICPLRNRKRLRLAGAARSRPSCSPRLARKSSIGPRTITVAGPLSVT